MAENYYEHVVRALRSASSIRSLGFRDGETDIRWYGKGAEEGDLLANYEGLRSEYFRAALAYAAAMVRNDEGVATA